MSFLRCEISAESVWMVCHSSYVEGFPESSDSPHELLTDIPIIKAAITETDLRILDYTFMVL